MDSRGNSRGMGVDRAAGLVHELDDAQFSTKMRGYDPSEVDALLDRARRAIEELHLTERRAEERATLAERQLEEELDAARTARATAEAEVATATAEAARIVADARLDASELSEAAEIEIRGAAEEARSRMLAEIAELENQRDGVREEIEVTAAHLGAHRTRLQRAVIDLSTLIEEIQERPGGLAALDGPGQTNSTPVHREPTLFRTTMPDVPEATADESSLPEPAWASSPTEVVRPIRLAAAPGASAIDSLGGAVGGDEGDLEAFFADDGS
ncbi:MAG: DivIVA domain-containing protein [Acidimicrobiales bacterium]|nr:DivIVA domain-containing protein [Acidimicrobiales bacterium]